MRATFLAMTRPDPSRGVGPQTTGHEPRYLSPSSAAAGFSATLPGSLRRKIATTRSSDTTNRRLSCSNSTGIASRGSNSTLSYWRMVWSSSFSIDLLIAITRPVMTRISWLSGRTMPLLVCRLLSSLRTTTRFPIGSIMSYSARRTDGWLGMCNPRQAQGNVTPAVLSAVQVALHDSPTDRRQRRGIIERDVSVFDPDSQPLPQIRQIGRDGLICHMGVKIAKHVCSSRVVAHVDHALNTPSSRPVAARFEDRAERVVERLAIIRLLADAHVRQEP